MTIDSHLKVVPIKQLSWKFFDDPDQPDHHILISNERLTPEQATNTAREVDQHIRSYVTANGNEEYDMYEATSKYYHIVEPITEGEYAGRIWVENIHKDYFAEAMNMNADAITPLEGRPLPPQPKLSRASQRLARRRPARSL